jgi:hypothetical protein
MDWDWIIALSIATAALVLALRKSTWIVDFTVFVFVFNRGLRRLVDFYINHEFSPLSPISLTPLMVAAAMLIPSLTNFNRFPPWSRAVLSFLILAIGYAFVIGFFSVQLAAIYALAEVMAPFGLFSFVLLTQPVTRVKDRWVRSFAWAAILASAYGWFQYLTIPEWDKFWLIETKMYGYMGLPIPTQMTVFSTMAERGPLASFLGFSVVPMLISKKWRPMPGILGWAGVILVFSVILLTLSRGGLLFAVLGTAIHLIINRGQAGRQIALGVAVVGTAAWFGMNKIPNAERVVKRFETIGGIQEDGSYKGRFMIMSSGFTSLAQNPFGLGLGAVGLATRVNSGSLTTSNTVVDAGYFNLILVYGVPGIALLLTSLILAWRLLARRYQQREFRDDHVLLARSMLITLIPACFAGDLLTGFSIFWLALGCGISFPPQRRGARSALPAPSGVGRGAPLRDPSPSMPNKTNPSPPLPCKPPSL